MKRMRLIAAAALLSTVAGCATNPPSAAHAPTLPAPPPGVVDRWMGKSADALVRAFGDPALDIREGASRKLQFANSVCVLDAYLYPPSAGRDPLLRYFDARNPNGDDYDKAACIAALDRRNGR